jgi:DNA-binding NtrC family response regulator
VCATHRNLKQAIVDGKFREDLYYRIHIVSIKVPPLRERREDISPLLDYFLARHAGATTDGQLELSEDARKLLLDYTWPGNVRELSNMVERMVVLRDGDTLEVDDLPEEILDAERASSTPIGSPPDGPLASYHDAVREAKRAILRQALARADNVQTQAAGLLGITQPYMARLMKNLGVKKR